MAANTPVSHVSDTAKWVAIYRAMESERPDALFRDPYARKLAGPEGEAIVNALPRGRRMAWPMIVRTVVMDEIIMRAISRDGVDTVLNLAAGLDTRPYRMNLPPALRWFEADFPDMVAFKETELAGETPRCHLERVKVDLRDDSARAELFIKVAKGATKVLVIAEGLLIYLEPEQVRSLARALHAQPAFHWWLIDLATPRLLKMMERTWGKNLAQGNAPFIFGPEEGTAFFEPLGWREAEFRSTWDESLRLDRTMPMAKFWSFVGRFYPKKTQAAFRRMSGIVLLQRT